MVCLVEILERKNPGLRGRGWKKCRQTEEKAREVTLRLVKFYWKWHAWTFYMIILYLKGKFDFVLYIFSYLQLHAEKEGVFTEYR